MEKSEEQIRELEDDNMLNENVINNLNLQLNKAGEVNETEKSEECENVNNDVLPKHWVKAYDCCHKFDDTFECETSVAMQLMDHAEDKEELEHFNDFSGTSTNPNDYTRIAIALYL